ncbi:MAG TPA: metal-dependent hydrolase [Anaerolineae bacterium]|nr:metal-dependent hydrolase [Anaerolineae bacterium]
MELTYTFHGHACFSLAAGGTTLLFDPFLTGNPVAQVAADDVAADYILLSHGHFDHMPDAAAIAQRTGATVIGTLELVNWVNGQGAANIHGMQPGGSFRFPFGRVKLTIAHHGSMLPDGSYGGVAVGFIVDIGGKRVYYTGDTALFLDMQLYGEEGIDVLILPIGDNFTMGPEDALRCVKFVQPKAVIPLHYSTWPPIAQDAAAFAAMVEATGVKCIVAGVEQPVVY